MDSETISKSKSKNFVDNLGNVYILGEFDETISTCVIPELVNVIGKLATTKNATITIYINSCGGYCYELYGLLTLLAKARNMGIMIVTVVIGVAYSAASMLAVCGDHRAMWKYATQLMHYGTYPAVTHTPLQVERETRQAKNHFKNISDIYKNHTKLSLEKIEEFMSDDSKYLTPQECLKYGLIDEIVDEPAYEFKSVSKPNKKKGK